MTKNKVKAADLKSLSAQELNEKKNQLAFLLAGVFFLLVVFVV
jgi:hypothetical protein